MNLRIGLLLTLVTVMGLMNGCKPEVSTPTSNSTSPVAPSSSPETATAPKTAGPLPASGFKAEVTIADPPTKLRPGQKETITIKVKNISDVTWYQRGGEVTDRTDNKFYIAAGNTWLDKDGIPTTDDEGHNGIPKDLKPGEETEMTLLITAPKKPGEYTMDLDMVQEQVAWFKEKGSTTTKVKITVVR
jgi:hypothetical protein